MKISSRRVVGSLGALVLSVSLVACGNDDSTGVSTEDEAPSMTNEFGVETFEPGDDTFELPPETGEPAE